MMRGGDGLRRLVSDAYTLHIDESLNFADVGRRIGVSRNRVVNWLKHPSRWDPVDDRVAIERALAGDRGVYNALTVFERETFFTKIRDRIRSEPYNIDLHTPNGGYGEDPGTYWLHVLEEDLGLHRGTLRALAGRRVTAAAS